MSQDLKKKKQDTVQPERTARIAPSERRRTRAAIPDWEEPTASKREERPPEGGLSSWYQQMRRNARHAQRRWRHIVREMRKHNFPESERAPILLVLFAWNMLPMLGSLLREKTWGRRKHAFHSVERLWANMERHRLHPAMFLGIGCTLAVVIALCSVYTVGTTVTYDGEVIGAVESQATADAARSRLERITTRTLGESFTIDDSLIQYSSGLLKRQDVVDGDTFEEDLSEEIGLVTPAYCLYVDGERIGATPYKGALEELMEQMKTAVTNEDTVSCSLRRMWRSSRNMSPRMRS